MAIAPRPKFEYMLTTQCGMASFGTSNAPLMSAEKLDVSLNSPSLSPFYGKSTHPYSGSLSAAASDDSLNKFNGAQNSPFTFAYFRYHNLHSELNGNGMLSIIESNSSGATWASSGILLNIEEWWSGSTCGNLPYCIILAHSNAPGSATRSNHIPRPPEKVWTHVTITFDGTTEKVYINGTYAQQSSYSNPLRAAKSYASLASSIILPNE